MIGRIGDEKENQFIIQRIQVYQMYETEEQRFKREEKETKSRGKNKKKEQPTLLKVPSFVPAGEEDQVLFEELRVLRKRLADQQAIPAYIVLSDKTLHLLAIQRPTTLEEFGMVSGIGEYKKERYGKDFVETIKQVLGK